MKLNLGAIIKIRRCLLSSDTAAAILFQNIIVCKGSVEARILKRRYGLSYLEGNRLVVSIAKVHDVEPLPIKFIRQRRTF